jgi:SAM-dependent methyltransferase
MINIEEYSNELIKNDGIFFAKNKGEISYPIDGHKIHFQVEDNSFWFIHRNNCIIELVKKYSPGNPFFDIGGGNGFISKGLIENGVQAVLVEPGIQGCLNAKERKIESIVCSTLENASFKANSIPTIGLFDVVEHIENDLIFLKSIYDLITKNGYVFITVPAFNFLWSNEDLFLGHYRRYTLKRLKIKLKEIGFKIEYSTYFFSILPIPIFFFRTLPSLFGLKKAPQKVDVFLKELQPDMGIFMKFLLRIWEFELKRIKSERKIPFGSSCFIIARKTHSNLPD